MLTRILAPIIVDPEFGRQMRFIAGPRQTGKTTVAKEFLKKINCQSLYYNWDERSIRDRYVHDSHFFSSDINNCKPVGKKTWLCMDEIHKYPRWKNVLKDFFDSFGQELGILVTGSAKLDMFRKSGDSLAGRYFLFHLNPLTLRETLGQVSATGVPAESMFFVKSRFDNVKYHDDELAGLLEFSGFPEPFSNASKRFYQRWQTDYLDRIISEDIRDLTHIRELENISLLMKLLPERISSPLSINSLCNDLKTTFATVSSYIQALEMAYVLFRIRPYVKKVARAISKETKVYFYDWTKAATPASQFENYVAMELKALTDIWTDSGYGAFELRYVRTRDGKESDFLILKNENPWMLAEAKMSRCDIEYHHLKNRDLFGKDVAFVQIVKETGIAEKRGDGVFQVSASRFFG
jgi:predicted AAA+ superfamily ATPase